MCIACEDDGKQWTTSHSEKELIWRDKAIENYEAKKREEEEEETKHTHTH